MGASEPVDSSTATLQQDGGDVGGLRGDGLDDALLECPDDGAVVVALLGGGHERARPSSPQPEDDAEDEDYCMFLQPSLNTYNMVEKLAEANRALALQQVREAAAQRRVTFQDKVVEFASEDGSSSEEGDDDEEDGEDDDDKDQDVVSAVRETSSGGSDEDHHDDAEPDQDDGEGQAAAELGGFQHQASDEVASHEEVVEEVAEAEDSGDQREPKQDDDDDAVFATFVTACSLDQEDDESVAASARDEASSWSPFVAVCEGSDVSSDITSQDEDVSEQHAPAADSPAPVSPACSVVDSASDSCPNSPQHDPTVTHITLFSVPDDLPGEPTPCAAPRPGRPKSASRRRQPAAPNSPSASSTECESSPPGSFSGDEAADEAAVGISVVQEAAPAPPPAPTPAPRRATTTLPRVVAARADPRPATAPAAAAPGPHLPAYKGLRSEYGLTAEQLLERRQAREAARRRRAEQRAQRRRLEDERRAENEQRFTEWLAAKQLQARAAGAAGAAAGPCRYFPCCPVPTRHARPRIRPRPRHPPPPAGAVLLSGAKWQRPIEVLSERANPYCKSAACQARARNMVRAAGRTAPTTRPAPAAHQEHHRAPPGPQHRDQHAVCVEDLLRGVSPHLQRTYRIYLGLTVK